MKKMFMVLSLLFAATQALAQATPTASMAEAIAQLETNLSTLGPKLEMDTFPFTVTKTFLEESPAPVVEALGKTLSAIPGADINANLLRFEVRDEAGAVLTNHDIFRTFQIATADQAATLVIYRSTKWENEVESVWWDTYLFLGTGELVKTQKY